MRAAGEELFTKLSRKRRGSGLYRIKPKLTGFMYRQSLPTTARPTPSTLVQQCRPQPKSRLKFNAVLQPEIDLMFTIAPVPDHTTAHTQKFPYTCFALDASCLFLELLWHGAPTGKHGFDVSYDSKKYMGRFIDIDTQPKFRGSHDYVRHTRIPLHLFLQ